MWALYLLVPSAQPLLDKKLQRRPASLVRKFSSGPDPHHWVKAGCRQQSQSELWWKMLPFPSSVTELPHCEPLMHAAGSSPGLPDTVHPLLGSGGQHHRHFEHGWLSPSPAVCSLGPNETTAPGQREIVRISTPTHISRCREIADINPACWLLKVMGIQGSWEGCKAICLSSGSPGHLPLMTSIQLEADSGPPWTLLTECYAPVSKEGCR